MIRLDLLLTLACATGAAATTGAAPPAAPAPSVPASAAVAPAAEGLNISWVNRYGSFSRKTGTWNLVPHPALAVLKDGC